MRNRPMRLFKNTIVAMASMASLSLAVVAAQAQDLGEGVGQGEDPFMPGVIGAEQGMSGIDFDSARMSFFNQSDLNGDLALSHEEIHLAMLHGKSRLFEGQDLDGNGSISLDEYLQSGNDRFQSLDTDGDGVLSSGEM